MMENNRSEQQLNVKRKLMFNKEEDYYFITYNIIIILNTLQCFDDKSKLIDYTKIGYLIPIISDSNFTSLCIRSLTSDRLPPREVKELFRDAYVKSRLKINILSSIIFTLESKGIISLAKNEKRHTIDIWLNKEQVSENLLNSELFNIEVTNIQKIKKELSHLKSLKITTFLEKTYSSNGVRVWES
ncbi:hypothetical protein [Sutcliffiella cohnii]|uniref:hypothetical protein n=1 Tax=Sutcliffiella cohnii TaxID=33932 RepID=UPI002E2472D5|nr:hypothetical protein [Sutcliffiella cohnii]